MMNVLVIGGNTGREYAVVKGLYLSNNVKLFTYQWLYNPFVESLSKDYVTGDIRDIEKILHFASKHSIDYAFVGQGESLELGLVDELEKFGIPCIGPKKILAKLEADKDYCINFVKQIDSSLIPMYKSFSYANRNELKNFAFRLLPKVVAKRDGKINSSGVKIFNFNNKDSYEFLRSYCYEWISKNGTILLQEYLNGEEVSLITYTDGTNFLHSPLTKNYKSIYDGEKEAQTSGMGAVTFPVLPSFITEKQFSYIKSINEKVLKLIQINTGQVYRGALFGEFMITFSGEVKLIEYNVRFGNPSFINHLSLLNTNLSKFFVDMVKGTLNYKQYIWKPFYSLSSYVVPKDYPSSQKFLGTVCDFSNISRELLYYANLDYCKDKKTRLLSSRAFAVCNLGSSLKELNKKTNTLLKACKGNINWRKDIGL